MQIETNRLILKSVSHEDKEEIFEYRSDSETNKYQGWIPEKIEDVEYFIGKIATQFNDPGTWFQFVIIEKELQKIIGDIGIHFLDDENMQVELGCTLSKDFQNKGYAFESLSKVIDYLFSECKKHRITASIDPENISSIRLFKKLGFRQEAHFVKSIFLNGKWVDDLIFALLAEDWKRN